MKESLWNGIVIFDNNKIRCMIKYLRNRPDILYSFDENKIKKFNFNAHLCQGIEENKIKDISYSLDYYDEEILRHNKWTADNKYLTYFFR